LANPQQYGFTKTRIDALDDPSLDDKSFSGPGADYVWWDRYHGTTKLHKLISAWHLEVLTNTVFEKLEAKLTNGSAEIGISHLRIGRDYTLQTSSDLNNWNNVQTFTASAGTNHLAKVLGDANTGFYRLQWNP